MAALSDPVGGNGSHRTLNEADAGGPRQVVPSLALRWSHATGAHSAQVVPCDWRATLCPTVDSMAASSTPSVASKHARVAAGTHQPGPTPHASNLIAGVSAAHGDSNDRTDQPVGSGSGPDQTGEQDNPGQHDNPGNGRAGDPLGLEGDNNNDAADDPDEEVTLAIPGVSVSGVSPDREAAEDVE